jgi:hypothetical protein
LLFVPAADIGHWYYPVPIAYISLCAVSLFTTWTRRLPPLPWVLRLAGALGIAALTLLGFARGQHVLGYHAAYERFVNEVAPKLRERALPGIVECDDGVINYGLRVPTFPSTRLVLDRAAIQELTTRSLYEVANERGFRAVGTVYYDQHQLRPTSSEREARAWARAFLGDDKVSSYSANILYADSDFTLVEVRPPSDDGRNSSSTAGVTRSRDAGMN